MQKLNQFKNKSILITGGTGSFGKQFVKRFILKKKFKKIIIFSRDELKQYEFGEEIKKNYKKDNIRFFLGDVRDLPRLKEATLNVDYIIHAAAQKQVDKAEYDPVECIKTNIIGTNNVIDAAIANNIDKAIILSTDKAVNPINLYGSTKLTAEKIFISANNTLGKRRTKLSVVRYGNVINSRGSLFEKFLLLKKQKYKYLPITDVEMTRFFMTLDQSVDFVSHKLEIMKGGEIFIPKIPSVKIVDLVKLFGKNMKFKIIGLRPGEKIHETLCSKEFAPFTIEFKKYFVIQPRIKLNKKINYIKSKENEKGKSVKKDFEYTSENNKVWYKTDELLKIIEAIK